MELLLHKYLSQYYYIKTSEVGNDGIYKILDDRRYPSPIPSDKIINEIEIVFGFNEKISQEQIVVWAISVKHDIDLTFYWETVERLLAIKQGVTGVPIQPIPLPRGELMYLDYKINSPTKLDRSGRRDKQEDLDKAINKYCKERQQEILLNIVNQHYLGP